MSFFSPTLAHADVAPIVIEQQYCSCVRRVHELLPAAPLVDARWYLNFPRVTPAVGEVAMFNYDGTYHVAYISELREEGFIVQEANFHKCQKGTRLIDWQDPHLVGFWTP